MTNSFEREQAMNDAWRRERYPTKADQSIRAAREILLREWMEERHAYIDRIEALESQVRHFRDKATDPKPCPTGDVRHSPVNAVLCVDFAKARREALEIAINFRPSSAAEANSLCDMIEAYLKTVVH